MRFRTLPIGIVAISLLAGATTAQAGIESWVSGTGTDAGTCPITAPCKTFAFAHNQTTANGAINVLSSGNFGPLTITKSISIVAQGVEAVINTAAGGAGIIVQVPATAIVSLRGLTIDMRGTANMGVSFVSGGALHVHDTVIRRSSDGIRFAPSAGSPELYVADTVIADCAASANIYVQPTASAGAKVTIERVRVEKGSNFGILFTGAFTSGSIIGTVRDTVSAGTPAGISAMENGAGSIVVMVDRSAAINSAGGTGILASGAGATIRIGDSTVTGNLTGLSVDGGGAIESYGTNKVNGNGTDGAPTSTIAMK
jgi:hypothetical protein